MRRWGSPGGLGMEPGKGLQPKSCKVIIPNIQGNRRADVCLCTSLYNTVDLIKEALQKF